MTIIYLDYFKAVKEHKLIDIKSFYTTYGSRPGYKMLSGTPLIINVDGSYVKVADLTDLIVNRSLVPIVLKWISAIKQPLISEPPFIRFYWRK